MAAAGSAGSTSRAPYRGARKLPAQAAGRMSEPLYLHVHTHRRAIARKLTLPARAAGCRGRGEPRTKPPRALDADLVGRNAGSHGACARTPCRSPAPSSSRGPATVCRHARACSGGGAGCVGGIMAWWTPHWWRPRCGRGGAARLPSAWDRYVPLGRWLLRRAAAGLRRAGTSRAAPVHGAGIGFPCATAALSWPSASPLPPPRAAAGT